MYKCIYLLYNYTTAIQLINNNNTSFKLENIDIDPLYPKERQVLDFIKKNPGKSKEDIIKYFEDRIDTTGYSRNPMYRTFEKLNNYNMIVIRKNPKNKQTNSIFINDESLLNLLIKDIEFVENIFFKTINKIEQLNIFRLDNSYKIDVDHQDIAEVLIFGLLDIYKCIIEIYFSKLLVEWPQKTNDKTLIDKAYVIFFFGISSILSRLSPVYVKIVKNTIVGDLDNNFINREISFTNPAEIFTFLRLEELLSRIRKLNIEKDFFELLDFVWPQCYLTKKTRLDCFPESVKDWRDIVPNFNSWMSFKKE